MTSLPQGEPLSSVRGTSSRCRRPISRELRVVAGCWSGPFPCGFEKYWNALFRQL